jgi:transposase
VRGEKVLLSGEDAEIGRKADSDTNLGGQMSNLDYIGFDVHKKSISFCAKAQDGRILDEGKIVARRSDLNAWAQGRSRPWVGALEATLFTGWIYDQLRPMAQELKVAHPAMLKAIAASKKKNDRIDARKIADLLRCNLLPECYMASSGCCAIGTWW